MKRDETREDVKGGGRGRGERGREEGEGREEGRRKRCKVKINTPPKPSFLSLCAVVYMIAYASLSLLAFVLLALGILSLAELRLPH